MSRSSAARLLALRGVHWRLTLRQRLGLPAEAFALLLEVEQRFLKTKQHRRYLPRAGDTVVEIGAFLGYYSMATAIRVGSQGRVVAVELEPSNFRILERNLERSFPDRTLAVNVGAWSEPGLLPGFSGGNQANSLRADVPARSKLKFEIFENRVDTIKNILSETEVDSVDLLVIQVNGTEPEALAGLRGGWSEISNVAIAANYDVGGEPIAASLARTLESEGLECEVFDHWVYGTRPAQRQHARDPASAPVFIGGCGRSGTTLVRVMLDRHPAFACGPESELLLEKPVDLQELSRRFNISRHELLEIAGHTSFRPQFIEAVMRRHADDRGKRRWAEKTPRNVRHLRYLFDNFPDAYFVHVIRDGRDVACSLRNHPSSRIEQGRPVPLGTQNSISACIDRWVADVSAGLEFRDHDNYVEVRYEDLIHDPERTMRSLLERVGESWDPSVLSTHDAARHDSSLFPQNPDATSPMKPASIGRWVNDLSASERRLVRRRAGDLLTSLGYGADQVS